MNQQFYMIFAFHSYRNKQRHMTKVLSHLSTQIVHAPSLSLTLICIHVNLTQQDFDKFLQIYSKSRVTNGSFKDAQCVHVGAYIVKKCVEILCQILIQVLKERDNIKILTKSCHWLGQSLCHKIHQTKQNKACVKFS